jgi:hypothetical protein
MNQVAKIETGDDRVSVNGVGLASGKGSKIAPQTLGEVVRFAEVMSRADIALPKHLRGNAGACMAVAMQALEWEMSPFAVASKSYAVNGTIAYEAQLIAAVVNTRSGIEGRLKYEFEGEGPGLRCRVTGVVDGDTLIYESPEISEIAVKNSPLWKSDPQQQLGYYSARSWARRHTPEVLLGVYDREEIEGSEPMRDVTPARMSTQERLAARRNAPQAPADKPQEGFDADRISETIDAARGASDSDGESVTEDGEVIDRDEPASLFDKRSPGGDEAEADGSSPSPDASADKSSLYQVARALHAELSMMKSEKALRNTFGLKFKDQASAFDEAGQSALQFVLNAHLAIHTDGHDLDTVNERVARKLAEIEAAGGAA